MPRSPDRQARLAKALRENLKRRKAHGARSDAAQPDTDKHAAGNAAEGHAKRESGPNPAEKLR